MITPSFLQQDSSWRTVSIKWSGDFNTQLRTVTTTEAPTLVGPKSGNFDGIRVANDNALRLLDSRQIELTGKLPRHICGMAFGGWSDSEVQLLSLHESLIANPEDTDEYRLRSNLVIAWIGLLRFNLANLALIDGTTPDFMLHVALMSRDRARQLLEESKPFEAAVEDAMPGLPSPTRHVRQALEFALSKA